VEKAAYAAVGAPIVGLKALQARIGELRDAVTVSGKELTDDLGGEFNDWISEGERVIGRAMGKMRSIGAVENVRSTHNARGAAEKSAGTTKRGRDRAHDVIFPEEPLTTINGVGASYASQLAEAGVGGVSEFLGLTGTSEDIDKLAKATGFSSGTIESWRSQVDLSRVKGIGGAYQRLLHRSGIWTLRQLGSADPAQLTDELNAIDMPDAPEQMPSIYTVKQWVTAARLT